MQLPVCVHLPQYKLTFSTSYFRVNIKSTLRRCHFCPHFVCKFNFSGTKIIQLKIKFLPTSLIKQLRKRLEIIPKFVLKTYFVKIFYSVVRNSIFTSPQHMFSFQYRKFKSVYGLHSSSEIFKHWNIPNLFDEPYEIEYIALESSLLLAATKKFMENKLKYALIVFTHTS